MKNKILPLIVAVLIGAILTLVVMSGCEKPRVRVSPRTGSSGEEGVHKYTMAIDNWYQSVLPSLSPEDRKRLILITITPDKNIDCGMRAFTMGPMFSGKAQTTLTKGETRDFPLNETMDVDCRTWMGKGSIKGTYTLRKRGKI